MERLPDTTGMKNEFIVSPEHRNGYDDAIRVAGAKLVEVGMNEQLSGAGVRPHRSVGIRGGHHGQNPRASPTC